MKILYHEESQTFHLTNRHISYIMKVLPDGALAQLYFGAAVHDRESYDYLLEAHHRPMTAYPVQGDVKLSPEHIRQEYPAHGSCDFRLPALDIAQANGSHVTAFRYRGHTMAQGKPPLEGLPATYTEAAGEAMTLTVTLWDEVLKAEIQLLYTIFREYPALARSARISNYGPTLDLQAAMSLCLDLPDSEYTWMQLSGAWGQERHPSRTPLRPGVQSVGSLRGHSSHNHNPFVVLHRPHTTEDAGEAIGVSLVYSGNFQIQAEVDTHGTTRLTAGIHPYRFGWRLEMGESFQTPEAVLAYTPQGLNSLSQCFHSLYRSRLARGAWRDKPRPVLINNWEATLLDFDEAGILRIAQAAREDGIELFVLDDGWFAGRDDFDKGMGDWVPHKTKLPGGIKGLAEKIRAMGLLFGLWFEPEMVNMDSDQFRAHPDWILQTPNRGASQGRHQYVLDFSRPEVVDCVYAMLSKILRDAPIAYIKWDMNRSITEAYSAALSPERQGEVFHRYILGVYQLHERLLREFPELLIESCSSGGGRFDPGMLYYAPQGWTSDDTDAVERLKIQYGTSYCYPLSSMGAHVSVVPNHQVDRVTPLSTRFNVACFGAFGYELDLNALDDEARQQVRGQVEFMKRHRALLQYGDFYRLHPPFGNDWAAWMVVSPDKTQAIAGYYKILNEANGPYRRLPLRGLAADTLYEVTSDWGRPGQYFGSELLRAGLVVSDGAAGQRIDERPSRDFDSRLFVLRAMG